MKSWIKSGRLSPAYNALFRLSVPILRILYAIWPSAWRSALRTSLSLRDIIDILQMKFHDHRVFRFNDIDLEYYFHSYNNFRATERAIEAPIIRHYLETEAYQTILEIGNVTNYYYDFFAPVNALADKVVVDKYEQAFGVINQDIRDFTSSTTFDFIFSISTFEHMDSDRGFSPEYVAGQSKLITQAADNIKHVLEDLLSADGVFVLTAPIGYSDDWDETFYSGELEKLGCKSYQSFGFRKANDLVWEQVDVSQGLIAKQDPLPFPEMNFVVVLEFRK